jgi:hypothetical protein
MTEITRKLDAFFKCKASNLDKDDDDDNSSGEY